MRFPGIIPAVVTPFRADDTIDVAALQSNDEIELYYRSIGEGAGLPIMAYNNPAASGVELGIGVIARLAGEVESVVAVKECSGDARNIASIIGATGDDFEVLVGGDDFALEGFCAGATGWVSGVANVVPGDCVRLYEACLVGALTDARSLYQRMLPLARLDMTPKLVQYFKRAMDQAGFVGGPCRAPRLPLTDAEEDLFAHAMQMLQAQPVS